MIALWKISNFYQTDFRRFCDSFSMTLFSNLSMESFISFAILLAKPAGAFSIISKSELTFCLKEQSLGQQATAAWLKWNKFDVTFCYTNIGWVEIDSGNDLEILPLLRRSLCPFLTNYVHCSWRIESLNLDPITLVVQQKLEEIEAKFSAHSTETMHEYSCLFAFLNKLPSAFR